jgi:hypothetical protein
LKKKKIFHAYSDATTQELDLGSQKMKDFYKTLKFFAILM